MFIKASRFTLDNQVWRAFWSLVNIVIILPRIGALGLNFVPNTGKIVVKDVTKSKLLTLIGNG
jgi:hypothetical protein